MRAKQIFGNLIMKVFWSFLTLVLSIGVSVSANASPDVDYGSDNQAPPQAVCDPDKVFRAARALIFVPPVDMQIRGVAQRVPIRPELNPRIGLWGDTRNGGARLHAGTDVLGDVGEVLFAPIDGVIDSGEVGGLGKFIDLNFEIAVLSPPALCNVHFRFSHLSDIDVSSGPVAAGQEIGKIGRTGNAIGADIPTHVHVEFWSVPQTVRGQNRKESTRDPLALFGW